MIEHEQDEHTRHLLPPIEKKMDYGTLIALATLLLAIIVQSALFLNAHYEYKREVEARFTRLETLIILFAPPELADRLRKANGDTPAPAFHHTIITTNGVVASPSFRPVWGYGKSPLPGQRYIAHPATYHY